MIDHISDNYHVLFLLIAIAEIIPFNIFAKNIYGKDRDKIKSLIYFTMPYFGFMYLFVTIRGGIALSLCLLAFSITKKLGKRLRQLIHAIVLYLVAFTLHRLVLLFLVIEAVYYFMPRLKKRAYWIIWFIAGIFEFANRTSLFRVLQGALNKWADKFILLSGYSRYIEMGSVGDYALSFRHIFFWVLGALVLYFITEEQLSSQKGYINIYIVGLFVMILFSFISGSSRISDYFLVFLPVLLANLNFLGNSKKKYKGLISLLQFFYGILGVIIITRL